MSFTNYDLGLPYPSSCHSSVHNHYVLSYEVFIFPPFVWLSQEENKNSQSHFPKVWKLLKISSSFQDKDPPF